MTIKQTIREASHALIGAVLAFSLMFQLGLGSVASATHAANRVQGLDRLGILCSVPEGRGAANGTVPEENHHTKDVSGCCSWGSRDAQPASLLPPLGAGFLIAYDAAVKTIVFVQTDTVDQPALRALRRQAPRAPPILI